MCMTHDSKIIQRRGTANENMYNTHRSRITCFCNYFNMTLKCMHIALAEDISICHKILHLPIYDHKNLFSLQDNPSIYSASEVFIS